MNELHKAKIRAIFKTYLIFKKKTSTNEFNEFLNKNNFGLSMGITKNQLTNLLYKNVGWGILKDVKTYKDKRIRYYELK